MLAELNVIGIIVAIVITIIASLLKKKEEPEEFELPPELKPKRERRPAQPKVSRWEEELRRALGEQPAPPPIVREVPPPVIWQQPPPLAPVDEYQRSDSEGPQEQPAAPRLHAFTEATSSYAQAASLLERTQEQLHQLHSSTHRAGAPAAVPHPQAAREVRALVDSLRQPHTARAAILASIVLGPPRALET